ncbi:transposase [Colletotrichum incanum]|uniref:Transposase n=1 Tax=Colletotrichum incanum TaxID=1573173 RepID=A0A166TA55_COLIC|nr:transposase [Colletotrichum incanum]
MQRVAIIAFVLAGRNYRETARTFDCSLGAVQKTYDDSKPARLLLLGPEKAGQRNFHGLRNGLLLVNYRQSYRELSGQWKGRVSLNTIKRVLKKAHYRKWRAMKRPAITPDAARQRLRFAREWLPRVEELITGMVWKEDRSQLVFLIRDENSSRAGYSSNSYIECLEEGFLPPKD